MTLVQIALRVKKTLDEKSLSEVDSRYVVAELLKSILKKNKDLILEC